MSRGLVVSLCDRTGIMVRPWAELGYECICVDVQHRPMRKSRVEQVGIQGGTITYQWGDVRTWFPPRRPAIVFAFPPCTHVTGANARDFVMKGTALLRDSLELFSACYSAGMWSGSPFMVENPVGKFSDHMRKPDYYFQPWEYGDLWTKKTCIWAGNGFVMPPAVHAQPPEGTEQKIWMMSPSEERGDLRSETPPAFARAVFMANLESARLAAAA